MNIIKGFSHYINVFWTWIDLQVRLDELVEEGWTTLLKGIHAFVSSTHSKHKKFREALQLELKEACMTKQFT